MPYKNKDETLAIKKPKLCKSKIRREMTFLLERMMELEDLIKRGDRAKQTLKEMEKEFKDFCRLELEGEE